MPSYTKRLLQKEFHVYQVVPSDSFRKYFIMYTKLYQGTPSEFHNVYQVIPRDSFRMYFIMYTKLYQETPSERIT